MRMNRKGYVYTVISMMLALVLLQVVSLYYDSYKSATDLSPAKLRTDELHYFVESAKKDLGRSMSISARRGVAYMADYVINNHTMLINPDPTTNLKQIMVNGTMTVSGNTFNVPYMQSQTLNTFISSLQTTGSDLRFRTNVSLRTIDVYMYDSLHFMVLAKYNFSIADQDTADGGVCGYENENQTLYVLVNIEGLEDPLYAFNTSEKVSRILNHSTQSGIQTLASGAMGNGTGGGFVKDVSAGNAATQENDIKGYNTSYPGLVPYTVFVINVNSLDFGSFDGATTKTILNNSGGVINEQAIPLVNNGFPYVSGVASFDYTNTDHVIIKNGNQHQIFYLWMANDIKNKLYQNSTNGSCFFDRLEGKGNLTDKYRIQASTARSLLGQTITSPIGIESYVNMSDLNASGLYADITPYQNYSSIDYLYFQNTPGKWVYGTPYWFRLDAYNLKVKNLTDYCYDNYSGVWHFEESYSSVPDGYTYTYDGSRYAHPLKFPLYSGVSIDPSGKSGSDLSFGGNPGDEADADVNVSESAYSLGLWFNTQTVLTPPISPLGLFSADDGVDGVVDRNIYLNSNGNLCADLKSGTSEEICTGGTYIDALWHHVLHTFENKTGGEQKLYVDGVLQAGVGSFKKNSSCTSQTRIRVGYSKPLSTSVGINMIGMIDDVKIWNRALNAAEAYDEYQKLL